MADVVRSLSLATLTLSLKGHGNQGKLLRTSEVRCNFCLQVRLWDLQAGQPPLNSLKYPLIPLKEVIKQITLEIKFKCIKDKMVWGVVWLDL